MLSFLAIVTFGESMPAGAQPWLLLLRAALPGGLFLWFAWRGFYPELRGYPGRSTDLALDVAVGLLGAALWVMPFVFFAALRPDETGFDSQQFGADLVWLAVATRAVGYVLVTPFVEELLVRSWLMRYIDVFDKQRDFRSVPIARFTWRSFLVVTTYFVFSHQSWEWGVMLLWTLLTMAWFYHRKHLAPLVLVHAVTNGAILLFAVLCEGRIQGGDGLPISFWFLV
jgi:CAAX prenyl protease-like protein